MESITVDSKNFHIPSFGNILKLPLAGSRPFHSSASRRERNTELYTAAAAGNSSIDASVPELLAFLPYARLALLPPWTGRKIGEGRYARHRAPVPYRDRPPQLGGFARTACPIAGVQYIEQLRKSLSFAFRACGWHF